MEPWRVKRLLTLACRTLEQKASQQSCAEMTECGHLPISIVDVCMNTIYRCPPISILVKLGFYKMLYENINTVVAFLANCGPPPQIKRAIISKGDTFEGTTRTYTCQGRTVTEGLTSITCGINGQWSKTNLYCRRKYRNQNC